MCDQESGWWTSLKDGIAFVPSLNRRLLVTGSAERWDVKSGSHLESDDFEREDLLLMQDQKGCYWWAFFGKLFKQGGKMLLHSSALSHGQANCIVKRHTFTADSDLRLSDLRLLFQHDKPLTIDETLEMIDLTARHLMNAIEVNNAAIRADNDRICSEVMTTDSYRARDKFMSDSADTSNVRGFSYQQWNGEGPSTWNSRIRHNSIAYRIRHDSVTSSTSKSHSSSRRSSLSSSSIHDEPYKEETPIPDPRDRKRSTVYTIMKLAFVPNAKLEAHQYKYDLKQARKEKKPEGYVTPSRWHRVLNQVRKLYRGAQRKRSVDATSSSKRLVHEDCSGEYEARRQCLSSDPFDCASSSESYQRGVSHPSVNDEEAISPLAQPKPASKAIRDASWLEIVKTSPTAAAAVDAESADRGGPSAIIFDCIKVFPNAEILEGVPSCETGPASSRQKKDSLGEAIVGACESKAPFADPGVSTVALGGERGQREWVQNGGWKWIFNEGMG